MCCINSVQRTGCRRPASRVVLQRRRTRSRRTTATETDHGEPLRRRNHRLDSGVATAVCCRRQRQQVLPTHHAASSRHACNVIRPGLRGEWVYCVLSDKPDMKRRSADLDLTNQRSAQLRSISVPYIRAFLGGGRDQECPNRVAWVCAAIVRRTASAQDEQKQNIKQQQAHTAFVFPHREPGCAAYSL